MSWKVNISKKAAKQIAQLPERARLTLRLLVKDLQVKGPTAEKWLNYGKLKGFDSDKRHCHLIKRRPTYVRCWEVIDINSLN